MVEFFEHSWVEVTIALCVICFFSGLYAEYLFSWFGNNMHKCETCKDHFYYGHSIEEQDGFITCSKCWDKEMTAEYQIGREHGSITQTRG
jgi:hypothetical protein